MLSLFSWFLSQLRCQAPVLTPFPSVLKTPPLLVLLVSGAVFLTAPAFATPFSFSTGDPDGKMGTASRPSSAGNIEIESADDFILNSTTNIDHATFTGLLPSGASVEEVRVEIYRVFPEDSDTARTSGPPTFSTVNVPTRVNSPSDIAFDERESGPGGDLTFTTSVLSSSFTVANTVVNGINPIPNQTTGGEGPASGEEVLFDITFTTPLLLPTDHYFFVPQVLLDDGNFLWLSAPKPIVSPGTPFSPDLQSWIRNEDLAPDWLRIGTDVVGGSPAPTFNAAFSLSGTVVPEPGTLVLMGTGLVVVALRQRKQTA